MKPLTIYTFIQRKHSASFYYRLAVPIHTAVEMGLPVRAIVDTDDPAIDPETRMRNFCESDVIICYQPVGEAGLHNVRAAQSFIPSLVEGEWKWPPTVIIETDDNLFNVSPFNQAFKGLGTRDMAGREIPDGNHIGVVQNGERRILWADGHDGFSLARNRQTLKTYRRILEAADAVSCSTQSVADSVSKEITPRRVKVFPNLVRMDHYEQVALADHPGEVRVLWQGGMAHYEDWFPLREAIGNVTRRYPEVHWIMWGMQFPWVTEMIPAERYTYMPWCAYQEYKLRRVMIGDDISLAPLQENVFNKCRSAIKFYEASVTREPAATLAQRSGAYKEEIVDGETALLFDSPEDFEQKLSLLIEDAAERRRLAANAKDWVNENRDAFKRVPEMVRYWEQLRDEVKRDRPHMPRSHWDEFEASTKAEEAEAAPEEQLPDPVSEVNKDAALQPV